jgi:hypothetical protein
MNTQVTPFVVSTLMSVLEKESKMPDFEIAEMCAMIKDKSIQLTPEQKKTLNNVFRKRGVKWHTIPSEFNLNYFRTYLIAYLLSLETTMWVSEKSEILKLNEVQAFTMASSLKLLFENKLSKWCLRFKKSNNKGILVIQNPITNEIVLIHFLDGEEWAKILLQDVQETKMTTEGDEYIITKV